jgi:hypothetical protein
VPNLKSQFRFGDWSGDQKHSALSSGMRTRLLKTSLLVLVTSSCGRLSFQPIELSSDGPDGVADGAVVDTNKTIDAPAAMVVQCSPTSEFTDPLTSNFDAGRPATVSIYQNLPARVSFDSGRAKIIPGQSNSPAYAGITSPQHDFTGQRIFVEAVKVLNQNTGGEGMLMMKKSGDTSTYIEFVESSGKLHANSWTIGSLTQVTTKPYDAALYRWWQIREQLGQIYFETSVDGINWIVFGLMATPAWWTMTQFELAGGTFVSEVNVLGEVHFDNLFVCRPAAAFL